MQSPVAIPLADEHLRHLSNVQAWLLSDQSRRFDAFDPVLQILSASLSAIYEAATCHRGCNGGSHVLEATLGRAYNLAVSSWALIRVAQYDEALNLIRGLGEINNLLLLFAHEPDLISGWLTATKKERMNAFGPAQVRKQLAKHVQWEPAGNDWYSELCERFVHVHPGTKPGSHSHRNSGQIGPVPQRQGEEHSVRELQTIVFAIALSACRWFRFDDSLATLGKLVDELQPQAGGDSG